jgi:hypothetical protein
MCRAENSAAVCPGSNVHFAIVSNSFEYKYSAYYSFLRENAYRGEPARLKTALKTQGPAGTITLAAGERGQFVCKRTKMICTAAAYVLKGVHHSHTIDSWIRQIWTGDCEELSYREYLASGA